MKIHKVNQYLYLFLIGFSVVSFAAFCFLFVLFKKNRAIEQLQNAHILSLIVLVIFIIIFLNLLFLFNRNLKKILSKTNESLHRYEALSNATNDAIWDFDIKKNTVFYNERLVSIFGYSTVELSNNTEWWETHIHADDKERVITRMNSLLGSDKISWDDEYRFCCKNGEYKIVFDRSYIVRDGNGKPIRLIGAMKDVTRMRALEKLLVDKKLQHKNILAKNIIDENESERKRVKYLLHEDVSQILVSVKFYISTLKTEHKQEKITTSVQYLDEVIKKINGISNKLFSTTFDLFGLKDAINDLKNLLQKDNDNLIKLHLNDFVEQFTNKSLSLHLYRIIEDRLTAIFQMVNANNIEVTLSNIDDVKLQISFSSADNDVLKKLNDSAINLYGKIELQNGEITLNGVDKNDYVMQVTFKEDKMLNKIHKVSEN
jgi:two-component system, NarL family, sensor histidine kinase UhpB